MMTDEHTWRWKDELGDGPTVEGLLSIDEVESYVLGNKELLAAASIQGVPQVKFIGNGEHNECFLLTDPEGSRCVLRLNRASVLGVDSQSNYEAEALATLGGTRWAPSLLYHDADGGPSSRGANVVSFCAGEVLDYTNKDHLKAVAATLADFHATSIDLASGLLHQTDLVTDLLAQSIAWYKRYEASPYAEHRVLERLDRYIRNIENLEIASLLPGELDHLVFNEVAASQFLIDGCLANYVDWDSPAFGEVARDVVDFIVPTTSLWDGEYVFNQESAEPFFDAYWEAVDGRFEKGSFQDRLDACVKACCLRGLAWCADALVSYREGLVPLKTQLTEKRIEMMLSEEMFELHDERIFRF